MRSEAKKLSQKKKLINIVFKWINRVQKNTLFMWELETSSISTSISVISRKKVSNQYKFFSFAL